MYLQFKMFSWTICYYLKNKVGVVNFANAQAGTVYKMTGL